MYRQVSWKEEKKGEGEREGMMIDRERRSGGNAPRYQTAWSSRELCKASSRNFNEHVGKR